MQAVWDIVVVGAGSAGIAAVEGAHRQSPAAQILLLDEDPHAPYKRTQLSKHIASGFDTSQFKLREEQWFRDNNVSLRAGEAVVGIKPQQREVRLATGETLQYHALVLACGAAPMYPRIVRAHQEDSFFVLRTMHDAQRLIKGLKTVRSVLIDGMGVLALEIANQVVAMKKTPTLVGATAQLMPRQLNTRAAEIMEDVLVRKKVKLLFQDEILSFEPNRKGGLEVSMVKSSGVYDAVIVCIGVQPRSELAESAGLRVERGVVVDDYLQTSAPSVFAAGDVAEHPDGSISYLWRAAEHQGETAGMNAAGAHQKYDRRPFRLKTSVFDTYVFSMNMPGDPHNYRIEEIEADAAYQCFYFADDGLAGLVVLNDEPRSALYSQAVVERWSLERVADELML